MELRTYLNAWPRGERRRVRQDIAQRLKVTESAVRHWANGVRRVPAERVLAVEHATGGQVTRYDLRPDIYPLEAPYPGPHDRGD